MKTESLNIRGNRYRLDAWNSHVMWVCQDIPIQVDAAIILSVSLSQRESACVIFRPTNSRSLAAYAAKTIPVDWHRAICISCNLVSEGTASAQDFVDIYGQYPGFQDPDELPTSQHRQVPNLMRQQPTHDQANIYIYMHKIFIYIHVCMHTHTHACATALCCIRAVKGIGFAYFHLKQTTPVPNEPHGRTLPRRPTPIQVRFRKAKRAAGPLLCHRP